jgi:hypothetical protein
MISQRNKKQGLLQSLPTKIPSIGFPTETWLVLKVFIRLSITFLVIINIAMN